jgi:RNA 3'-terminal phosphate cyclase (ATP)/RNA 3'-terminal phosphate cyclase (GTP)
MEDLIEIDGSQGGGSVVRLTIGLAVALQKPVRITNIRGIRKDPGLKAQHLAGLLATAQLCAADVEGAAVGSREITFVPHEIRTRELHVRIPTAGAVGLVLQPLQIACLAVAHDVDVHVDVDGGGTFGKWAPPLPYLEHVNFALLARHGYPTDVVTERHGFYPRGGALVRARFHRPQIRGPLRFLQRGSLTRIQGLSLAAEALQEARVAERQAQVAVHTLERAFPDIDVSIETRYAHTASVGSAMVLRATFAQTVLGADLLGERGVPAERIGQRAAEQLLAEIRSEATLDVHMADQIIPFVALYGGAFRCREITDHVQININVAECLTDARFVEKSDEISVNI